MSKTLVIAEKPSMAREIAKVLGAHSWSNGAASGAGYVVTNAIGHLVELCEPEVYNDKWITWDKRLLPIIPEKFAYEAKSKTKPQFETLRGLLRSGEFSEVVNACDAGREGELIFRLIYELAGSNLPIKRLWISSLTAESIKEGFANLKPGALYDGLRDAAKLRQEADWLIGLNATRAQTAIARETGGGSDAYSLGRVQTPTLSLVVFRDNEIENFKSVPYFELKAEFQTPSMEKFSARMFDISTKQVQKFDTETEANQNLALFRKFDGGGAQVASLVEKEVKTNSPPLFDLTLLQRTANERHGMTAAKTLEVMQSLYEQKLLTYPRTGSCYLSEDVAAEAAEILNYQSGTDYALYAAEIKDKGFVINPKKVDNAKVTDHHAIIPTNARPDFDALSADEKKIYDLVMRRFLAAFYPAAEDKRVNAIVTFAMAYFAAKGTTELRAGWRIVERDQKPETEPDDDAAALPPLVKNMDLTATSFDLLPKQTNPPKKFTEATLLQAMETAGKYVKDENLRDAMKAGGLGTAATRAATIEGLINKEYLIREKKALRSTPKARAVINRLVKCDSLLVSPTLTGQWEEALGKIERGEFKPDDFRASVINLTRTTVSQILAQSESSDNNFAALEGISQCPACASAGRKGVLVARGKPGSRKYSFCSLGKDVCNYITDTPNKKKFNEKLLSEKCPKCKGVMTFGLTKEKQIPLLRCFSRECDGVFWLEPKTDTGKKSASSKKQSR